MTSSNSIVVDSLLMSTNRLYEFVDTIPVPNHDHKDPDRNQGQGHNPHR